MKETAKLSSAYNVKNTITEYIFAEIDNAAYIMRKNIV